MFLWLIMVTHHYFMNHGHVFIFHTHGQECNHSASKTWLTIVIIMVITRFPMVNHSSLKKEYIDSLLWAILLKVVMSGYGSNMSIKILTTVRM